MGKKLSKYNSSFYRVKPLMDYVLSDKTSNKVNELNKIFNFLGFQISSEPICIAYGEEKALNQSNEYLFKLVEHLRKENANNKYKLNCNNQNRKTLFYGSEEEKDSIIKLAKNGSFDAERLSFEGSTKPDIFIEGIDYVIVCEGKWTEPKITEETTNLLNINGEYRNQMIRHIQGAINNYSNKKIYAFYIVDAECKYLDKISKDYFPELIKKETIQMNDEIQKRVQESYYGYITWQELSKKFDLHFMSKEEIDEININ